MPTPQKVKAVEDLTDKMRRAKLAVVTDYRGLSVRDLATLRARRGMLARIALAPMTLPPRCRMAGSISTLPWQRPI